MKLTQQKIAERLGMCRSYVSEIFSGSKSVGIKTARKIAAVTGRDWKRYLDMPGRKIEAEIRAALGARDSSRSEAA